MGYIWLIYGLIKGCIWNIMDREHCLNRILRPDESENGNEKALSTTALGRLVTLRAVIVRAVFL
jgi:hypothetical protein